MRSALDSPPTFPETSHLSSSWKDGKGRFLIDGFPRKMDQAVKFDRSVCESTAILFFDCSEDVMLERLTERGKTSGREDDNKESIVKRFRECEDLWWLHIFGQQESLDRFVTQAHSRKRRCQSSTTTAIRRRSSR